MVAKQEGFKDHKEMAEYMKAQGYEWNVYRNNYVKMVGKLEDGNNVVDQAYQPVKKTEGGKMPEGIEDYLPFLRFLYEKRDEV